MQTTGKVLMTVAILVFTVIPPLVDLLETLHPAKSVPTKTLMCCGFGCQLYL